MSNAFSYTADVYKSVRPSLNKYGYCRDVGNNECNNFYPLCATGRTVSRPSCSGDGHFMCRNCREYNKEAPTAKYLEPIVVSKKEERAKR